MSLVKHIVARCESKPRLADSMSEILSALLIKLTTLSRHEEDMKANKKPLDEVSQFRSDLSFSLSNSRFRLTAAHNRVAEFGEAGPAFVPRREEVRAPHRTRGVRAVLAQSD